MRIRATMLLFNILENFSKKASMNMCIQNVIELYQG